MTVTNRMHKGILIAFSILCIVGVLLLLRVGFVLGMSAYMNAEATSKDGNLAMVSAYYDFQSATGDFMEPYIAYYNSGTALAKANQPDKAEKLLQTALDKVDNQHNECFVRNNLAKVQEQLGDYYMVSDMPSTAQNYYSEAVKTISDAPASCFPPPPPSGGNNGQQNPNGNPTTPGQSSSSSQDAQNGQSMKQTQQESETKQAQAQQAQSQNAADGQDQVKQEMDQAQSNTSNQQDVTKQQESSQSPSSAGSGTGNGQQNGQSSQTQPPTKPW